MGKAAATTPEYADYVTRLGAREAGLADELSGFTGIEHVLTWMQRTNRAKAAVDIVGQDEFEYDFLIQLKPGGRWLAFGVT